MLTTSLFSLSPHSHSPIRNLACLSSQIDSELQLFLSSRAREFKRSGLFVLGFPVGSGRSTTSSSSASSSSANSPSESFRSKSHADLTAAGSPPIPPSASSNGGITRRNRSDSFFSDQTTPVDVWRQLTLTISVAVQRLVSIGTVKASVAHLLLEVPLWARSSAELRKTLSDEVVTKDWEVVESCGMKEKEVGVASPSKDDELEDGEDRGPLSVCHPAYRALVNGTMSRGPYVEHCVAFIKVGLSLATLFSEMRSSLRSSFLFRTGRLRMPSSQRPHGSRRDVERKRRDGPRRPRSLKFLFLLFDASFVLTLD